MGGKSEPFLYKLPLLKCLHDTQKKYFSMFAKHSCASAFNYMGAPSGETSFLLLLVFVQTSYNFRLTVLPLQRQNIVIGYVEQFQAWEMKLRAIITKGFASATFTGFRLGTPALPDHQSGRSGSAGHSPRAAKRDTVSGRFNAHPMPGLAEKPRQGEARLQLDQKPRSVSQWPGIWDVGGHVSGRQHSDHQRRPQIGDIFVRHIQFACARLNEHSC